MNCSGGQRPTVSSQWRQCMTTSRVLLCPHVLGRKGQGRRHVLVYQIGGRSNSGLPVVAAGGGVWRGLAVEKLSSDVELRR